MWWNEVATYIGNVFMVVAIAIAVILTVFWILEKLIDHVISHLDLHKLFYLFVAEYYRARAAKKEGRPFHPWNMLPDDLFSHEEAWRSALVIAKNHAEQSPPDIDDKSYWEHEIKVFDRVWKQLDEISSITQISKVK
jgi:hypothetical protein